MPLHSVAGHALRRVARACLRFVSRLTRLIFILGLMALPLPLAALVVSILKPERRNVPAEVLRKKR
jgi:hypothetical protein